MRNALLSRTWLLAGVARWERGHSRLLLAVVGLLGAERVHDVLGSKGADRALRASW